MTQVRDKVCTAVCCDCDGDDWLVQFTVCFNTDSSYHVSGFSQSINQLSQDEGAVNETNIARTPNRNIET